AGDNKGNPGAQAGPLPTAIRSPASCCFYCSAGVGPVHSQRPCPRVGRSARVLLLLPGFNFSVEFRRNFGVFFVFASYREEKFRYFSLFFVFKFKNSKIFIKNSKKY